MDFLSDIIRGLLENISSNGLEFHFHCEINDNNSTKKVANEIIELIEDADNYNWVYHHQYVSKKLTTYWYFCSQRDILAKKPRKHPDTAKQRDVTSIERFDCGGFIKISINEITQMTEVTLYHRILHEKPMDMSITQNIKDFIKNNIDLLPREIYARLISEGINLLVRQKQIHFWWSQLGQDRYKRHDNAFESAYIWLLENQYNIILQQVEPVHALAFDTGFLEQLNGLGIIINESGIDATCEYIL